MKYTKEELKKWRKLGHEPVECECDNIHCKYCAEVLKPKK